MDITTDPPVAPAATTHREFLAQRVQRVKPSGIRRFFDIAATMHDVISMSIGEPDFVTGSPGKVVGQPLDRGTGLA